jgi:hypothetical protein
MLADVPDDDAEDELRDFTRRRRRHAARWPDRPAKTEATDTSCLGMPRNTMQ